MAHSIRQSSICNSRRDSLRTVEYCESIQSRTAGLGKAIRRKRSAGGRGARRGRNQISKACLLNRGPTAGKKNCEPQSSEGARLEGKNTDNKVKKKCLTP